MFLSMGNYFPHSNQVSTRREEVEFLQVFLKLFISTFSFKCVTYLVGEWQEGQIPLWKVFSQGQAGTQMPPWALCLVARGTGSIEST